MRVLGARAPRVVPLDVEVDVVSLDNPDIPLLLQVIEHGVVVHDGRAGAHGAWRARALSELDIDGPWYRGCAWLRRVARESL